MREGRCPRSPHTWTINLAGMWWSATCDGRRLHSAQNGDALVPWEIWCHLMYLGNEVDSGPAQAHDLAAWESGKGILFFSFENKRWLKLEYGGQLFVAMRRDESRYLINQAKASSRV